MELIMLGTGNAGVADIYNTCFVLKGERENLLVDAGGGNGIFGQLKKAGVALNTIRDMYVTHSHTDHILGAVWVVRRISAMQREGKYDGVFTVYCHDVAAEALETICRLTLSKKDLKALGETVIIERITDGEIRTVQGMELTFFDIFSTKAKQFGFTAILPDGQKLVCLGDEPYNEACHQYAKDADWLMSEAFCLYGDREVFRPYEKNHSTALDAGRLAQRLGAKNLILYHTEEKTIATRKEAYTAEAQTEYTGSVYVPNDLETIPLG